MLFYLNPLIFYTPIKLAHQVNNACSIILHVRLLLQVLVEVDHTICTGREKPGLRRMKRNTEHAQLTCCDGKDTRPLVQSLQTFKTRVTSLTFGTMPAQYLQWDDKRIASVVSVDCAVKHMHAAVIRA